MKLFCTTEKHTDFQNHVKDLKSCQNRYADHCVTLSFKDSLQQHVDSYASVNCNTEKLLNT